MTSISLWAGAGTLRRLLSALFRCLVWLSLGAAALTVLGLAVLGAGGQQVMVVASGSMTPTFRAGDAVVVRPPHPQDLRTGAVVSFHAVGDPEHLTTHRIIATHQRPEGLFLQTQGDANATPDPDYTPADAVVGVMTRPVPRLGYWLAFFQSPTGRLTVLGLPLLLLAGAQLRSTLRLLRRRRTPAASPGRTLILAITVVVVSTTSGALLARATGALYNESLDESGNSFTTSAYCGTGTTYQQSVTASSPLVYHRFSETTGTTAANSGSGTAGTYTGGYTLGVPGATACETTSYAVRLDGATGQVVRSSTAATASTNTFTLEAWIRTTTGGGKIIGWGNSRNGASTTSDRHLYLTDTGILCFGVNPTAKAVISSPGSYLDGRWHHVAATLGTDGMRLYVDGTQVAARTDVTAAGTAYNGYWRIGYDTLTGWPAAPTRLRYTGDLDEVAIYTTTLTATQIATHYNERRG